MRLTWTWAARGSLSVLCEMIRMRSLLKSWAGRQEKLAIEETGVSIKRLNPCSTAFGLVQMRPRVGEMTGEVFHSRYSFQSIFICWQRSRHGVLLSVFIHYYCLVSCVIFTAVIPDKARRYFTSRYTHRCYSTSASHHTSSSNSFADGRSLQSSFIIFDIKTLSLWLTSVSDVRENGVVFSFGIFSIINMIDWTVSGSAISAIFAGKGPKYLNCSSTTPSTYSSSSRVSSLGWKRLKFPP